MDPAAILARVLDEPRVARVMSVLDLYGRAAGGLLANGLAFSALFAAIPTALFVLGLAGWITADPNVQVQLGAALVAAFPPLKDLIDGAMEALRSGAALTSLVGALGVIWTVSQLYGALDVAFARIFSDQPERNIVRRTARGFLLVGIIGFLIVALIAIVALAALFDSVDGLDIPLGSAISRLISSIPFLMGLSVAAMVLIYRALPPKPPHWRSLIVPAVIVGIAIVVLSQVFTFLVPRLVGVAALAGSIASAFVALAWLSFTFQAVLYGAAWVRVREGQAVAPGSAPLEGPAAPAETSVGGE
jgi:membrane protein